MPAAAATAHTESRVMAGEMLVDLCGVAWAQAEEPPVTRVSEFRRNQTRLGEASVRRP